MSFQKVMDGTDCWNTNYLSNVSRRRSLSRVQHAELALDFSCQHDRARSITRYASDAPEHRIASGKLLAIYLLTQSGTPFIYQGEEIGTINAPLSYPIEDYKDTESINWWAWINETYKDDPATIQRAREGLQLTARDHARMPMQWTDGPNGGFTGPTAAPWQKMNPSYDTINVQSQLDDPDSVLSFHKRLLSIRKRYPELFAYGTFEMLNPDNDDTMVWIKGTEDGDERQALVVLNFTGREIEFEVPTTVLKGEVKLVLSSHADGRETVLQPYEGRLYFCNVS